MNTSPYTFSPERTRELARQVINMQSEIAVQMTNMWATGVRTLVNTQVDFLKDGPVAFMRPRTVQNRVERAAHRISDAAEDAADAVKAEVEEVVEEVEDTIEADLTRIKGIGPVFAEELRLNGILSIHHLAALDPDPIAVEGHPLHNLYGNMIGDEWIEQARELSS